MNHDPCTLDCMIETIQVFYWKQYFAQNVQYLKQNCVYLGSSAESFNSSSLNSIVQQWLLHLSVSW